MVSEKAMAELRWLVAKWRSREYSTPDRRKCANDLDATLAKFGTLRNEMIEFNVHLEVKGEAHRHRCMVKLWAEDYVDAYEAALGLYNTDKTRVLEVESAAEF